MRQIRNQICASPWWMQIQPGEYRISSGKVEFYKNTISYFIRLGQC